MIENNKRRLLHNVYGIVLSTIVVAVLLSFAISCAHIYFTGGNNPFTVDSIRSHLKILLIPTIICLIGIVGGFVLNAIFPYAKIISEKRKINVNSALNNLSSKVILELCANKSNIIFERKKRIVIRSICAFIIIVLCVICLVFALDYSRYSIANINSDVAEIVAIVLPLSILGIGIIFASDLLIATSKKRELDLLKNEITLDKNVLSKEAINYAPKNAILAKIYLFIKKVKIFFSENETASLWVVRGCIFIIAVTFIVVGVLNGGMADVLGKAIRICTECIGLG